MPFRDQLELDSMDFLDIVMELRKRYRVQIPEEDYPALASMASTVKYLEPLMKDVQKQDRMKGEGQGSKAEREAAEAARP